MTRFFFRPPAAPTSVPDDASSGKPAGPANAASPPHGAGHGAAGEAAEEPAGRPQGGAPSPLAEQGGDGAPKRRPGRRTRQSAPYHGARHGVEHGAADADADAGLVIARLEEAGSTLLALPGSGWSPGLRQSRLEMVRTALETAGWETPRARAPAPSPARVSRMDEALDWIRLIPRERYVLRRIVGARALVHPLTGRHLFSWRRLGALLGADHKAIQRWHAEAIALIVAVLHR